MMMLINEPDPPDTRQHPVTSIVVRMICDRPEGCRSVVMLHPLRALGPGENQVLFDGSPRAAPLSRPARAPVRQGEARTLGEIARNGRIADR